MGHPLIVLENCYLNYLSSILNLLHGIIGNKPPLQISIPTRSMYCFVLPDLSTLSLLIGPLQVIYHLLTRTILDNPRSSGVFSLHAPESDIDWRMSACWSVTLLHSVRTCCGFSYHFTVYKSYHWHWMTNSGIVFIPNGRHDTSVRFGVYFTYLYIVLT